MLLIVNHQKLDQIPIAYFFFPIFLQMECCIPLQLHVHLFPQHSPKCVEGSCVPFEMILLSIPKCTQTYPKKNFTTSFILMVFLQGIGTYIFFNLTTITYSCIISQLLVKLLKIPWKWFPKDKWVQTTDGIYPLSYYQAFYYNRLSILLYPQLHSLAS